MTTKLDTKNENMSQNNKHIPNPMDLKNTSETRWTKVHIISPQLYIIKNSSKTKLNIKNKRKHRR